MQWWCGTCTHIVRTTAVMCTFIASALICGGRLVTEWVNQSSRYAMIIVHNLLGMIPRTNTAHYLLAFGTEHLSTALGHLQAVSSRASFNVSASRPIRDSEPAGAAATRDAGAASDGADEACAKTGRFWKNSELGRGRKRLTATSPPMPLTKQAWVLPLNGSCSRIMQWTA